MELSEVQIGDRLKINCDSSCFRDDIFTVVGMTDLEILAVVDLFDRRVEVHLDPQTVQRSRDDGL